MGWWCMVLRKGVYMDGHERPDVMEYWKNTFLPLMALHKKKMVQWVMKGSKLVYINLDLGPGKKRVITVFQNKSCFHVNEYKQTAWCTP